MVNDELLDEQTAEQLVGGLLGDAGRDDPYPFYWALRSINPVLPMPFGTLVLGYDDCSTLLQTHAGLRAPEVSLPARGFPEWEQRPSLRLNFRSMLARNPPDHSRLRRLVSKAFTRREVERLIPAIEAFTDALVGRIAELAADGARRVEFISACANPRPVWVVGELLGIPPDDRPAFQQLVFDSSLVLEMQINEEVVSRADAAATRIVDYFETLIDDRRSRPRDDLTSQPSPPRTKAIAWIPPARGVPGLGTGRRRPTATRTHDPRAGETRPRCWSC